MMGLLRQSWCWLLVMVCAVGVRADGQDQQPLPPRDDSTVLFQALLNHNQLKPITPADLKPGFDYEQLVLIVIGDLDRATLQLCSRTLARGGAVAIATDRPTDLSSVFQGQSSILLSEQTALYTTPDKRDLTNEGYVSAAPLGLLDKTLSGTLGTLPELELFQQNRPLWVREPRWLVVNRQPSELKRTVAVHPPETYAITINNGLQTIDKPTVATPFALAGAGDTNRPYRCVVMASTSHLTNEAFYRSAASQGEVDNFAFANRLAGWLRGPQERTQCMLLIDGEAVDDFGQFRFDQLPITLPDMPPPPLPEIDPFDREFQQKASETLNGIVKDADISTRLQESLKNDPRTFFGILVTLLLFACIVLYLLVRVRTLFGNKYKATYKPFPRDPVNLGSTVFLGSLDHRKSELLRQANYGPSIRSYLYELFLQRGLPTEWDSKEHPPVEFLLKNKKYVQQYIEELWGVYRSNKSVTYSQWIALQPKIDSIRRAAQDDRWRFIVDQETRGTA